MAGFDWNLQRFCVCVCVSLNLKCQLWSVCCRYIESNQVGGYLDACEAHKSQSSVLHRLLPCHVSSENSLNFVLLQRQVQKSKEGTTNIFLLSSLISLWEFFWISPVLNEDMVSGVRYTNLSVSDRSGTMADSSTGGFREVRKEHWTNENESESSKVGQKREENRLGQM